MSRSILTQEWIGPEGTSQASVVRNNIVWLLETCERTTYMYFTAIVYTYVQHVRTIIYVYIHSCSIHVLVMWNTCGAHVIHLRHACYIHVICMLFSCDTCMHHACYMWHACFAIKTCTLPTCSMQGIIVYYMHVAVMLNCKTLTCSEMFFM